MFKSTMASTVEEYIKMVPDDRRDTIITLHKLIQETIPSLKPYFATNMVGYGSFAYKNYKKEIINWPTIALANQKNYISLYVCAVSDGMYLAEKYKNELGKVNVGKSCIRFKKLSDINATVLKKLLKEAAKNPGFGLGA